MLDDIQNLAMKLNGYCPHFSSVILNTAIVHACMVVNSSKFEECIVQEVEHDWKSAEECILK